MSGSGSKALEELRQGTKELQRDINNFGVKIEETTSRMFKGIQQLNTQADQHTNNVHNKLGALQAKLDKLREEKRQEEAAKQSQSSNSSAPSKTSGPK